MPIVFTARAAMPADVLITNTGGESVLLNVKTERYFGLDDVGTSMWQALTTRPTLQAAYDDLLTAYDVAPDVLKRDLAKLVEKLVEQGLLEIHDA